MYGCCLRSQIDASTIAALLRRIMGRLPAGARLGAVLEQPVPNRLNGKHSWWSSGLAYGVWQGALHALDVEIQVRRRVITCDFCVV